MKKEIQVKWGKKRPAKISGVKNIKKNFTVRSQVQS